MTDIIKLTAAEIAAKIASGELTGEVVEFLFGEFQTRQPSEVCDLLARDARHAAILWGESDDVGPILWGPYRCP